MITKYDFQFLFLPSFIQKNKLTGHLSIEAIKKELSESNESYDCSDLVLSNECKDGCSYSLITFPKLQREPHAFYTMAITTPKHGFQYFTLEKSVKACAFCQQSEECHQLIEFLDETEISSAEFVSFVLDYVSGKYKTKLEREVEKMFMGDFE